MGRCFTTIIVGLAVGLAACGDGSSDDDPPEPAAAKESAQAAVADFMAGLGAGDPAAACDLLTEAGHDALVDAAAEMGVAQLRGDSCDEVLQGIVAAPEPNGLDATARFAEAIRTGDVANGSLSVAIAEDTGTVTITDTAGKSQLSIPVEAVNGAWLVANANTLVFGVGSGGS